MRTILFLGLLFLTSCVTATASKLKAVQVGMDRETVIAALGEPNTVEADKSRERLVYYLAPTDDDIWDGTYAPYAVEFQKGHVVSYGQIGPTTTPAPVIVSPPPQVPFYPIHSPPAVRPIQTSCHNTVFGHVECTTY